MKKFLSLVLAALLLFLSCPAFGESRPVLTIGDTTDYSGDRISGDDQLGLWRYLEYRGS